KWFSLVRLTTAYTFLNRFLKPPSLGSRCASGICPPSKPSLNPWPRASAPFWPRPEVFPLPEPVPRPTLRDALRDPSGARSSCKFTATYLPLECFLDERVRGILYRAR